MSRRCLISVDQQVKHQFVSVRLWPKMTSIVDSEAHLAKRATEVGLTVGGFQSLVRNGLSTLGRLAFAHGQPGTPIDAAAFHTFAQNLLGALMSLADEAALKRLLFEGHTMVLSQLREAVANPEAAHTRKLPQVERNAKMITLRAALPGVCIEKQLEPSHSLLDLVSQQFEAQQLAYLSPDRCTSREWEVAMGKTSKQIQLDTDHLVVKEKSDTPDQVAATEMQIYEALRRRGVAYAFADLLEWTVHERYITQLFGHLRKDPPQGYVKTSIQQLLRADRAVWAKIIEDNVPVRRDATGLRPLDAAVPAALHSPEIAFHLVQSPRPIHAPKNEWKAKQWGKDDEWKNKQWNKWQPYDPKKAKGKGKGVRSNMVPKAFKHKDCVSVDHHGRRLCFGYNLKKCTQVSDGAQCNHGWHLCLRKGCHAPHPEVEHDSDKPPDPRH